MFEKNKDKTKEQPKYSIDDVVVILDLIKYNTYLIAESILYAVEKDPVKVKEVLMKLDVLNAPPPKQS